MERREVIKLFWDCDGTLVQVADEPEKRVTLRPHAKDIIQTLKALGIESYIWSRAGKEHACEVAKLLDIERVRCFAKPEFEDPDDLSHIETSPDLVIDDDAEESVMVYPHIVVRPYKGEEGDKELLGIIPTIRQHYDAIDREHDIDEVRVSFKRRKRTPLGVKMKRKRYYRRHRSKYRRYRRKYRRRPRAKRIARIRRRMGKRLKKRSRRYTTRVSI